MKQKQQINFRASELTSRQLAELQQVTGMSQTEVVSVAVDRMHKQEIKMPALQRLIFRNTEKFIDEQHIGEGVKEAIFSIVSRCENLDEMHKRLSELRSIASNDAATAIAHAIEQVEFAINV